LIFKLSSSWKNKKKCSKGLLRWDCSNKLLHCWLCFR
jgi:hypothetical protein